MYRYSCLFFFKQKTAYEIKECDWSSDVCSSDLVELTKKNSFEISWIDTIVIIEKPKLAPFIDRMKNSISKTGILLNSINIKAKTNERMGFIGKGEGIAAQAVCLLKPL